MSNELLIEHRAEILQGFLETSNVDESIDEANTCKGSRNCLGSNRVSMKDITTRAQV